MQIEDCFQLGKITKPHSYKGEVVVWFDVDEPDQYAQIDGFFVATAEGLVPFFIESMRPHQDRFVARLEGVADEAAALALAGADLYLPLSALPELDDAHFYFHEVPGWEVWDLASSRSAGQIQRVVEHGPYPLLETQLNGQVVLIPLPDHLQVHVDRKAQRLSLELPEGVLDVYLEPAGPSDDAD